MLLSYFIYFQMYSWNMNSNNNHLIEDIFFLPHLMRYYMLYDNQEHHNFSDQDCGYMMLYEFHDRHYLAYFYQHKTNS